MSEEWWLVSSLKKKDDHSSRIFYVDDSGMATAMTNESTIQSESKHQKDLPEASRGVIQIIASVLNVFILLLLGAVALYALFGRKGEAGVAIAALLIMLICILNVVAINSRAPSFLRLYLKRRALDEQKRIKDLEKEV
jgi:hypothetical protein